MSQLNLWPGRPYPLGATWDGAGVNFALFAEHATAVELCLFGGEDGNEESVLTLQHAEAPIQCDVLVADGAAEGWSADSALSGFDRAAVESTWRSDFADFTITAQQLTGFQSGPALYYEGEARQSPMGFPVKVMHAEAADGGRTYIFECIMDLALAEETRPVVQFMIANFSTRSDAECCVAPRP